MGKVAVFERVKRVLTGFDRVLMVFGTALSVGGMVVVGYGSE